MATILDYAEALEDLKADLAVNFQPGDDIYAIADQIAKEHDITLDALLALYEESTKNEY